MVQKKREDGLYLHQSPSRFHLVPLEQHGNNSITIDRSTGEIELIKDFINDSPFNNTTTSFVFGIIGIKRLIRNSYLIVITSAKSIAKICDEPIYELKKAELIPFKTDLSPNKELDFWEDTYKSMLESVLKVPGFYFSPTYNLTNTLQQNYLHKLNRSENDDDLFQDQYLWNGHLVKDFRKGGNALSCFWVPLIHGYINCKRNLYIGVGNINWTLISRRSCKRAGTRFNTRGVDQEGYAANFVETEQIVDNYQNDETKSTEKLSKPYVQTAYVQVRGSIPLAWSQKANYRYKPAIKIDRICDQNRLIQSHFQQLKAKYNDVTVVNLIDSRGHEGELENEFRIRMEAIKDLFNIPYYYFDFHKECSKMRYHNLAKLMDKLQRHMSENGFFAIDQSQNILNLQKGVIRSNCIDSLDRTNVLQSYIGKEALRFQVPILQGHDGSSYKSEKIDDCVLLMQVCNMAWAENADTLSIQYAGTPALKTDFTRTGKRTRTGMINDGVNSLTRYISNNFCDDYRQDAIDLFLGTFEGYPSPLYKPMAVTSYTSPLPVSIVMLTLVALYMYFRYSRLFMVEN